MIKLRPATGSLRVNNMKKLASIIVSGLALISLNLAAQPIPEELLLANHPTSSSDPRFMVELDGMYYFVTQFKDLWQTDGTPENTTQISISGPAVLLGDPITGLAAVDGKLIIFGGYSFLLLDNNQLVNNEPALVDLATLTFHPLRNINQIEYASSNAKEPYQFGEKVLFLANDGIVGQEIWITDGTTEGTHLLKDINPAGGINSPLYLPLQDRVVIVLQDQLWITDGTTEGTFRLKDFSEINSGIFYHYKENFCLIGGELFFRVTSAGYESIWKTDGTVEGTHLINNILTSGNLRSLNNRLFHFSNCCGSGAGIYEIDLTSFETSLFYRLEKSPIQVSSEIDGFIYFKLDNDLWRTNGTLEETSLTKEIDNVEYSSSFEGVNSKVLFESYGDNAGLELWVSDGTEGGTHILRDFNPGSFSSSANFLYNSGNILFLSLNDGSHGKELWATDGTESGTVFLGDLNTAHETLTIVNSSASNEGLFIKSNREWPNIDAPNLVRYSGSPILEPIDLSGNRLVTSTWGGNAIEFNDETYFTGQFLGENPTTTGLFKYAGGGASLINELNSGSEIVHSGSKIFLNPFDDVFGNELWVTNGEVGNAFLIKDIAAGRFSSIGSGALEIVSYGEQYLFAANDRMTGAELWATDLTAEGTSQVKDIRAGAFSSNPSNMYVFNDNVYFTAENQAGDINIWISDGTEGGTSLLFDFTYSIQAIGYHPVGSFLYFFTTKGDLKYDLWRTDGTTDGTELVENLGQFYTSYSAPLMPFGDKLVFAKIVSNETVLIIIDSDESQQQLFSVSSTLRGFIVKDDHLFIICHNSAGDNIMIRTDGTPENTSQIYNFTEVASITKIDNPIAYKEDIIFEGSKNKVTSIYRLPILHSSAELEYKGTQQSSGFEISFDDAVYNQASEIEVVTISNTG
jgi:ELWxxDGT repeat protein